MRRSDHPQAQAVQPPARTHTSTLTRRILALVAALLAAAGIAAAAVAAAAPAHGTAVMIVANRPTASGGSGDPGST